MGTDRHTFPLRQRLDARNKTPAEPPNCPLMNGSRGAGNEKRRVTVVEIREFRLSTDSAGDRLFCASFTCPRAWHSGKARCRFRQV